MIDRNRSAIPRAAVFSVAVAIFLVFGSQSTTPRALTQNPLQLEVKQAKQECDIDGCWKELEDCPSETIIRQYKEKYDVTVVWRGGVYWQVVSGEYLNENYGYRVVLPESIEGLCMPPPMPWHGFFVDLGNQLNAPEDADENRGGFSWRDVDVGLYVDAHYNATFYASVGEAIDADLNRYKNEHPADLVVLTRKRTTLRRLPAICCVVQFADAKSGKTMIVEEVVAIRGGEGDGIVYSVVLTTTADRYNEDEKLLRQILAGWRTTKVESADW